MFVRTMETLAGGEWTGADTCVEALHFCTRVKTAAIHFGR